MICETSKGRVSELDRSGNLLWSYVNPTAQNQTYDQYAVVTSSNNRMFRAEKYPLDYTGFVGKELTPSGILENSNYTSDSCIAISLGLDANAQLATTIVNPVINNTLEFKQPLQNVDIQLFDMQGKTILIQTNFSGTSLPMQLSNGIYLLKWNSSNQLTKIVVD
jgi:hypothetical protein